jgi:hypothetical protein
MCSNHGLQHYPTDLRDIAREITGGDAVMAAKLLDMATHDGLAAFMVVYGLYCADDRAKRIQKLLDRSTKRRGPQSVALAGDVVNLWDTELTDMLPY